MLNVDCHKKKNIYFFNITVLHEQFLQLLNNTALLNLRRMITSAYLEITLMIKK